MRTLTIYLLETFACSGLLLAAYAFLLERRVRFGWCRAYLLVSTALAGIIPLLRIPVWPGEAVLSPRRRPPHPTRPLRPMSSRHSPKRR